MVDQPTDPRRRSLARTAHHNPASMRRTSDWLRRLVRIRLACSHPTARRTAEKSLAASECSSHDAPRGCGSRDSCHWCRSWSSSRGAGWSSLKIWLSTSSNAQESTAATDGYLRRLTVDQEVRPSWISCGSVAWNSPEQIVLNVRDDDIIFRRSKPGPAEVVDKRRRRGDFVNRHFPNVAVPSCAIVATTKD